MGTIRDFMNDALAASYDPSGQYRASMRTLTAIMNGEVDDISPANPVVYALETQGALIAAFTENMQSETRRLLQVAALTPQDLYPHMADVHFTNIFNLPAKTTFTLILDKKEILNSMKPIAGTMSSKVTIPRDTYFTISDYVFGIHYPIDIIQQVHGGIRVAYDTSQTTPLQALTTNILKTREVMRDGVTYLAIDIDVFQFVIASSTPTVTQGTTFSKNIAITDLYYATRVYRTLSDGTQQEIPVTYSEKIYDPLNPCAVVKLLDGVVNVSIPQIYINNQQVLGELRIDIYTTKGPLQTDFSSYSIGSIGYRFRDLNKNADTTYTAPMQQLDTCTVLGEQPVSGGVLAMTFDELRTAVISDAIGDPTLPITPAQIQNYITRLGYDVIKNIDIVTDRVFLGSRNMPDPTDPSLLTAANASIETMNASFTDLIGNSAVVDNTSDSNSVTLTPSAIYQLVDGTLKLVDDSTLTAIKQMRSDLKATYITNGNFLYSPFYYVLDKSNNQFRLAPYYLDNPQVLSQTFLQDNEGTLLQVNTNGYDLLKTATGFQLKLTVKSNDDYKALQDQDVQCILGFKSPTEEDPCWLVGTLFGTDPQSKERIFTFDLNTQFAMDVNDRIDFRNFKMYDTTNKTIYADLTQDFTVIYATQSQMGNLFVPGMIDALLPRYLVGANSKAICEERLTLKFGDALSNLWARARSVASTVEYETYPTDQILRYSSDQWKTDPATGNQIFMVDGKPTRVLLHAKGDPILDDNGNQQIQFPAGSVVYDYTQNPPVPVVKNVRYLKHRFELFLIEGVYAFSNDDIAVAYRNTVAQQVASWVTTDMVSVQKASMDKSRVYFYPKTIFGTIEVMVADGIVQQISAGQRFDVALTVSKEVYQNEVLKAQLVTQTTTTIAAYLTNQTLANSDIVENLRVAYGDDVLDAQVSLFGDAANIPVMQLVNEVHRCGIRKRLVSRDDDKLVVEEDINVTFSVIS
ncbi:putative virion stractural protein [Ralstonia phage RSF1]|uniref:Putative virion stractural protein n=1 Tax=Ralstonia phage RSF1 TaxID=1689679 RepID=A0A0K2QQW9_9CAUD|nr:putative virion stractural protein [Ralstonia phage RSF1]BAS04977.1 putative virion stractural protein [Ralstonia phage RSF1]